MLTAALGDSQQNGTLAAGMLAGDEPDQMLNSTFGRRCCALDYVAYALDGVEFMEAGTSFRHITFRLALERA